MLNFILQIAKSIFGSPITSGVIEQLGDLYLRKMQVKDEIEQSKIDAQIKVLELQASALANETKHWMTTWIRPSFALIVWVYYAKILVWDKVLGLGVTDDLNETQFYVVSAVMGAYFLVRPIEKIFRR